MAGLSRNENDETKANVGFCADGQEWPYTGCYFGVKVTYAVNEAGEDDYVKSIAGCITHNDGCLSTTYSVLPMRACWSKLLTRAQQPALLHGERLLINDGLNITAQSLKKQSAQLKDISVAGWKSSQQPCPPTPLFQNLGLHNGTL
jgi:hypothetical protein